MLNVDKRGFQLPWAWMTISGNVPAGAIALQAGRSEAGGCMGARREIVTRTINHGKDIVMKTMIVSALLGLAMIGASGAAEAKCIKAGGEASAITPELSQFLAKAALNNSINSWGGKGVGKTKVDCKYDLVLSACKAQQRACK